jgi:hypothetical protein
VTASLHLVDEIAARIAAALVGEPSAFGAAMNRLEARRSRGEDVVLVLRVADGELDQLMVLPRHAFLLTADCAGRA